ncbi:MAG: T9SS type A sorting domain-containing protein [Bacteroidota bacterium]|nr:T9SS type A sorting domain-containing protein [Bacteroidota bacterium]
MQKLVTRSFVVLCLYLSSSHFGVAQQWTAVNNGLSTLLAPSIVSNAETVFVSVYGGGVYKSTNFGDNWTSIDTGLSTLQVNAIEMAPYVLAGTDSGVYRRVSESTWEHLSTVGMANTHVRFLTLTPGTPDDRLSVGTPGGIFRQLHNSDWESANNGLSGAALDFRSLTHYRSATVNYGITGTAGGVYMTFDNFASWQRKSNGLTGRSLLINKVLNLGSPAAIAATDSGLFATTDVGENWFTVIPSEKFMTAGGANYPGTGFGIYAFGDRGFVTTDFSSWLEISLAGTNGGHVLDFATTQNYLFVTTQSGGVFRKALANITGANEAVANTPHVFNLFQNYPNPFNPATTISFDLPERAIVSLKVFNVLGQEVASLLDKANLDEGGHSVEFDASALSSSVYFYRLNVEGISESADLNTGSYTEQRKMILLK